MRKDDDARGIAAWTLRLVHQLERQWVPATALPCQLIHGDIRLGNVARTTGGHDAYLDFGFAARRPRIHELAYSLLWIVLRPDNSGQAEDFHWHDVAELVDAYQQVAGDELDGHEVSALAPYLAAVPLYLASVAAFTAAPAATLRAEVPSLRIADWVLSKQPRITAKTKAP